MFGQRWEFRHAYGYQGYRKGGAQGDGDGGGNALGAGSGGGDSGNSVGFGGADVGSLGSPLGGMGSFGGAGLGSSDSASGIDSGGFGGGLLGSLGAGSDALGGLGLGGYGIQGYGAESGFGASNFGMGNATNSLSNSFLGNLLTPSNLLNSVLSFALGGLPGLGMSMLGSGLNAWGATEGLPGLGSGVMAGKALLSGNPIGAVSGLASAARQGLFGNATPGSALSGNLGINSSSNLGGSQSLAASRQSINRSNSQINPAILALLAGAYTNKGGQNG